MTPVNSAVKMVGQLKRWLTGDEGAADSHHPVEKVSCQCSTCACSSTSGELQYRGRSYSDCCAVQCRAGHRYGDGRERSCSVSDQRRPSHGCRRLGPPGCRTSLRTPWSSGVGDLLEEDRELCHCLSGSVEPVCCCERCFVYVDDRPSLLPPPYSQLLLLEQCADLAKKLIDADPSAAANSVIVTDRVMGDGDTGNKCESSSAKNRQSSVSPTSAAVSDLFLAQLFVTSVCSVVARRPVIAIINTVNSAMFLNLWEATDMLKTHLAGHSYCMMSIV